MNLLDELIELIESKKDENAEGLSKKWANWKSVLGLTTCKPCRDMHGTIYDISILQYRSSPEVHPKCYCRYVPMKTLLAGTATDLGELGADMFLVMLKKLPSYYVDKEKAKASGWKKKKR